MLAFIKSLIKTLPSLVLSIPPLIVFYLLAYAIIDGSNTLVISIINSSLALSSYVSFSNSRFNNGLFNSLLSAAVNLNLKFGSNLGWDLHK